MAPRDDDVLALLLGGGAPEPRQGDVDGPQQKQAPAQADEDQAALEGATRPEEDRGREVAAASPRGADFIRNGRHAAVTFAFGPWLVQPFVDLRGTWSLPFSDSLFPGGTGQNTLGLNTGDHCRWNATLNIGGAF